jgi:hypothetical protein
VNTTTELDPQVLGKLSLLLGKRKEYSNEGAKTARLKVLGLITNCDPEWSPSLIGGVQESLRQLWLCDGSNSLDMADTILAWAIAFPYKVGQMLEIVSHLDIQKKNPVADGFVLGFFEAANVISIDNASVLDDADCAIHRFLSAALRERWWDSPEFELHSYVSGRLSGALSSYMSTCWTSVHAVFQRRSEKVTSLIRSTKLIKPDEEKDLVEKPDKNLHWSLVGEMEIKFILEAPPSERHDLICRGMKYQG